MAVTIIVKLLPMFVGIMFGHVAVFSSEQNVLATPRFEYSTTLGCGDVFFHAVNLDRTEFLRIEVDFAQFKGSGTQETFNLTTSLRGVEVVVAVYPEQQINRPNCTDLTVREIGKPPLVPVVWRAVRGTLLIERGPKGVRPDEPWLVRARLRLEHAAFQAPSGEIVEMDQVFTWEGYVGWQAG